MCVRRWARETSRWRRSTAGRALSTGRPANAKHKHKHNTCPSRIFLGTQALSPLLHSSQRLGVRINENGHVGGPRQTHTRGWPAVVQSISTRILGRRTAPFLPFLISDRAPHGVTYPKILVLVPASALLCSHTTFACALPPLVVKWRRSKVKFATPSPRPRTLPTAHMPST